LVDPDTELQPVRIPKWTAVTLSRSLYGLKSEAFVPKMSDKTPDSTRSRSSQRSEETGTLSKLANRFSSKTIKQ
jgi:hypothetical protein